jgi:hypothetical protein
LTELRFAVQDRNLYFQHPDGTWEGGQRPGQMVLAEVIMLEEVRADLRRAAAERSGEPGRVVRRRRVHGSISHDAEFARRRRRNTIGQHIWLRCREPQAPAVLAQHLSEVVDVLGRMPDVVIEVRPDSFIVSPSRWEWGESTRDWRPILVHQVVHELGPADACHEHEHASDA